MKRERIKELILIMLLLIFIVISIFSTNSNGSKKEPSVIVKTETVTIEPDGVPSPIVNNKKNVVYQDSITGKYMLRCTFQVPTKSGYVMCNSNFTLPDETYDLVKSRIRQGRLYIKLVGEDVILYQTSIDSKKKEFKQLMKL